MVNLNIVDLVIKILLIVILILLGNLFRVLNRLVSVFLQHWVRNLHLRDAVLVIELGLFLTIVIVNLVVYLNVHFNLIFYFILEGKY